MRKLEEDKKLSQEEIDASIKFEELAKKLIKVRKEEFKIYEKRRVVKGNKELCKAA
ncbi:MAG: hypothetical protein KF855_08130 [Acidobacteria bacterium]|nr:hypothetical protein [Acidobacteriota bacterium]